MYSCKHCGRPVERAIEGELVCEACWSREQQTEEERQADAEIAQWERWSRSHCEDCEKPLPGGGVCPDCRAEREQVLAELGWD